MPNKYYGKNEFRYNTNPKIRNKKKKGHVAYMSATHGKKSLVNIVTHSKKFFKKSTKMFAQNPNVYSKDPRPSRFSKPYWEDNKYLKSKPYGFWRITKKDRAYVKKSNKQYFRKNKW